MEFNTNQPFVAIWSTGYVLSEKAVKEVGLEALQSEYGPFTEDDFVRLIPTTFELEAQVATMVARRSAGKKARSEKNGGTSTGGGSKKRKHDEAKGSTSVSASALVSVPSAQVAQGAQGATAVAVVKNFTTNSSLVKNALTVVKGQEAESSVYKGLFHKDKAKDTHDGELFMAVGGAGFRYTIN
jgi:hypothetical protein